jgi:hypothetical protein
MLEHRRKLAERLSRLVCLMVGTDKPGECVAAAAALQRALASAGMNHHDLADAVEAGIAKRELAAPAKPVQPEPERRPELTWREMLQALRSHWHKLPPKEQDFLISIAQQNRRTITPKQHKWLYDICHRVGANV